MGFAKRLDFRALVTALLLVALFWAITGLLYPLLVSGVGNVVFPGSARGSLVERDGRVVGSALIGQSFQGRAAYFQGRPSAAGEGYDAARSGGSNLGPTNDRLTREVEARARRVREENGLAAGTPVPADLVTASASGLDPHISPQSAYLQVARVARERGLANATVRDLVRGYVEPRTLGFMGEPRVNVLMLNLRLDERCGVPRVEGAH
ncbi:MAG: potassium-transporting ATPase subunit KdpC [Actinomycetota bacterium]